MISSGLPSVVILVTDAFSLCECTFSKMLRRKSAAFASMAWKSLCDNDEDVEDKVKVQTNSSLAFTTEAKVRAL